MYRHTDIEPIIDQFDHNSDVPLHIQVEKLLIDISKLPEYANGKLFPKEISLAKSLGVSRGTVREATNRLSNKKVIVRKKGIGTRVNKNMIVTSLDSWSSFSKEMLEQGNKLVNNQFKFETVLSDKKISYKLGIEKGKEVVCLSRVRGVKGESKVYFISFFHPKLNLHKNLNYDKPLYDLVEEFSGYIATISREEISAISADNLLSDKLKIEEGAPVLKRERVVLDRGMSPLEYNIGYYKAKDFKYSLELRRDIKIKKS